MTKPSKTKRGGDGYSYKIKTNTRKKKLSRKVMMKRRRTKRHMFGGGGVGNSIDCVVKNITLPRLKKITNNNTLENLVVVVVDTDYKNTKTQNTKIGALIKACTALFVDETKTKTKYKELIKFVYEAKTGDLEPNDNTKIILAQDCHAFARMNCDPSTCTITQRIRNNPSGQTCENALIQFLLLLIWYIKSAFAHEWFDIQKQTAIQEDTKTEMTKIKAIMDAIFRRNDLTKLQTKKNFLLTESIFSNQIIDPVLVLGPAGPSTNGGEESESALTYVWSDIANKNTERGFKNRMMCYITPESIQTYLTAANTNTNNDVVYDIRAHQHEYDFNVIKTSAGSLKLLNTESEKPQNYKTVLNLEDTSSSFKCDDATPISKCLTFCCGGSTSDSPPAGVSIFTVSDKKWEVFEPTIKSVLHDDIHKFEQFEQIIRDKYPKIFRQQNNLFSTKIETLCTTIPKTTTTLLGDESADSDSPVVLYRSFKDIDIDKVAVIGDIHGNGPGLLYNLHKLNTQGFFKEAPINKMLVLGPAGPSTNTISSDDTLEDVYDDEKQDDVWDGEKWILNPKRLLIFTGDIVDRGKEQLQCLYLVYSLFVKNMNNVVLCRGNHEYMTQQLNTTYKFPLVNNWATKDERTQTKIKIKLQKWHNNIFNKIPVLNLVEIKDNDTHIWMKCMHGYGPFEQNEEAATDDGKQEKTAEQKEGGKAVPFQEIKTCVLETVAAHEEKVKVATDANAAKVVLGVNDEKDDVDNLVPESILIKNDTAILNNIIESETDESKTDVSKCEYVLSHLREYEQDKILNLVMANVKKQPLPDGNVTTFHFPKGKSSFILLDVSTPVEIRIKDANNNNTRLQIQIQYHTLTATKTEHGWTWNMGSTTCNTDGDICKLKKLYKLQYLMGTDTHRPEDKLLIDTEGSALETENYIVKVDKNGNNDVWKVTDVKKPHRLSIFRDVTLTLQNDKQQEDKVTQKNKFQRFNPTISKSIDDHLQCIEHKYGTLI